MSNYVLRAGLVSVRYVSKGGAETIHYKNARKWKTKEAARQYALNHGLNTYHQVIRVGPMTRYTLV